MTDLATKLALYSEFLDCSNVSLWHYDGEMRLISSNHPNQDQFHTLFTIGGSKERIHKYCLCNRMPGFSSDLASLLWLAAPQYTNDTLTDIYIIGPVFSSSISERTLNEALQNMHISTELQRSTSALLKTVPTVHHTLLMQYGLMLYRCLTGEKLETADINAIYENKQPRTSRSMDDPREPRKGTYALELQIFQAVEDGNIDYVHPKELYQRKTGILSRNDPLKQAKSELISGLTLITRAAIRGGMPEDSAYALSDYYIQMGMDCENIAAVYQYTQDAFKDFTARVHKYKTSHGHSKEIRDCISYLQLHLGEKLNMSDLAESIGYNKNYLSTKFGREVGMSISEYMAQLRVERAKVWLQNTDKPIQQISDELGFNSVSYFSAQFRKAVGQSPSDYRNRKDQ